MEQVKQETIKIEETRKQPCKLEAKAKAKTWGEFEFVTENLKTQGKF